MPFPRPDEPSRSFFKSVLPDDSSIQVWPMFGNAAALVNANIFAGLFGSEMIVRLSEEDRARLLQEGAAIFEPMKGQPMKEYVTIPKAWREERDRVRAWVSRSLGWVAQMPAKTRGGRRRQAYCLEDSRVPRSRPDTAYQ